MVRRYRELSPGKMAIVDILCDRCGQSTRTISGYEKAVLSASFKEGFHVGDRFIVELCPQCFDAIMVDIVVENMGTCTYYSEVLDGGLEMEDIREMYAYLASGTLIYDEDDVPNFDDDDAEEV